MKQEDKDLLLKDLCARLPYGVKLHCISNTITCISPYTLDTIVLDRFCNKNTEYIPLNEVKPYLFPLSGMTIEQKEEERSLKEESYYSFDANENIYTLQDFYNKNHLDYRGLIPMGLAIDATNLNIY